MLIGISGGSGSGKTTLANILKKALGEENSQVLALDSFYPDLSHLEPEKRISVNYDDPLIFDYNEIFKTLNQLKSGQSTEIPIYDFVNHTRAKQMQEIVATKNIIFEGIYAFYDEKIFTLFDKTIFVEANNKLRLERRSLRDQKERGRTPASVIQQWEKSVRPMYEKYCVNSKNKVDKIIFNNANDISYLNNLEIIL